MSESQKLADVAGFEAGTRPAGQGPAARHGLQLLHRGLQPGAFNMATPGRPACSKPGGARVHPTGSVTVFTGSHSHNQGTRRPLHNWWRRATGLDRARWTSCTATPAACPSAWHLRQPVAVSGRRTAIAERWTRSGGQGQEIGLWSERRRHPEFALAVHRQRARTRGPLRPGGASPTCRTTTSWWLGQT